ncbi:hypothetical protein BRC20_00685 [Candidatus Saccharibacteria bacterium QS_8_54_8]|nr:MAG: hypothetical protein BRC20_00685 [Candidatus Saccharibacteria bacterium QS_8_54_8]
MPSAKKGLTTPKTCLIIAVVIVIGGVGWLWYRATQDSIRQVNSFEECAAAGYPIQESDPRRCHGPDGHSFTEEDKTAKKDQKEDRKKDRDDSPATEDQQPGGDREQTVEYTSNGGDPVRMRRPHKNSVVSSPLTIKGEVKGRWAFEGDFPVELTDGRGEVIARTPARLQGDHRTENLVPFQATVEYPQQGRSGQGQLILRKSNSSGQPERDDVLKLPIRFSP